MHQYASRPEYGKKPTHYASICLPSVSKSNRRVFVKVTVDGATAAIAPAHKEARRRIFFNMVPIQVRSNTKFQMEPKKVPLHIIYLPIVVISARDAGYEGARL